MSPRTLVVQNQIRSTTSGTEYIDTYDLAFAEEIVNEAFLDDDALTTGSGTIIMDLNFLRTAVRDIKGSPVEVNWFDQVVDDANYVTLSGARGSLNSLHTYTGAEDDFDTTPDYDTLGGNAPTFINQGDPINVAIEKLDGALATISGSQAGEIAKRKLVRTGGRIAKDTTITINTPGAGWTATGDNVTWTDATDFVENVSVFVNGVLQLPGSSSGDDNDVYFVASPDSLAFEFRIRRNDVIQVWKFPPSA
jgi:hypothetical protein